MKKTFLLSFALMLSAAIFAQQMVTLTFTAHDAVNQYVRLNRVVVTNHTKGWQETIYWPDTILVMQGGTGMGTHAENKDLHLSQNAPNPFRGSTEVILSVADKGTVVLEITDMNGRPVKTQSFSSLQTGTHCVRVSLASAGFYVMTARQNGRTSSIKMICNGGSSVAIQYAGSSQDFTYTLKSSASHPFDIGDKMEYVGYAISSGSVVESQHIVQTQTISQTFELQFAGNANGDGNPCLGMPTVRDHEGNTYHTVQIGSQCWTKENMRCITSPKGFLTSGTNKVSNYQAYYYNYLNSTIPLAHRGKLYNWAGAMDTTSTAEITESFTNRRGICPQGWHVPSGDEWWSMISYMSCHDEYLCGEAFYSNIAKSLASQNYWYSDTNTCAIGNNASENNATGFSAIGAGYCITSTASQTTGEKNRTYIWSSSSISGDTTLAICLTKSSKMAYPSKLGKQYGFSVRCLRDVSVVASQNLMVGTGIATAITQTTVTLSGDIYNPDNVNITGKGFVWKRFTENNYETVNVQGEDFTAQLVGLSPNTEYTYKTFITYGNTTLYGNEVSFMTLDDPVVFTCGTSTVTDHQGNVYNTVQIGTQCWTKENMRCTTSPHGYLEAGGNNNSSILAYYYNSSSSSIPLTERGLRYNWLGALDTASTTPIASPIIGRRGICPQGWHVPSYEEWLQMTNYVGSQNEYQCVADPLSIVKALVSENYWTTWINPCSPGCEPENNNATGFSVIPTSGGDYARIWTSSSYDANTACHCKMAFNNSHVSFPDYEKSTGISVRCLRD